MAKSMKSVYFDSKLMILAEEKNLDINHLCNEALRLALNDKSLAGEELNKQVEQAKDNQVMNRIKLQKGYMGREKWAKAVPMYARKYNLTIDEVLRKFN